MKNTSKRLLAKSILAALISLLGAGCNTAQGLGEDIEDLGENIQD